MNRCTWVPEDDELYIAYHDEEWGVPVHDDRKLFEMLILEGAQAGLNWRTILGKRDGYRKVFHNFDIEKCSALTETEIHAALENPEIIRNKLKVRSVIKNAAAFMQIQEEFGSFDTYLWGYVDNKPVQNQPQRIEEVPASTELSDQISKDLKKRGMSFVGSTIIYAYLQAVGVVNDHTADCRKAA